MILGQEGLSVRLDFFVFSFFRYFYVIVDCRIVLFKQRNKSKPDSFDAR